MLSKMAMEDIAALRADGIDVPPREVVRLNALGLRVERGPLTWTAFAAPRVAFLGDHVLYEPTLGAEMWLRQASDAFNVDDAQTWFSLRVLSCIVPWRDLPDPANRKAVMKAVRIALDGISGFTIRQVENALAWCIEGDAAEKGESPPPKPSADRSADDDAEDLPPRYSPEFGLFMRGTALRIGTAAAMKDMTYSMMVAACDRAEADTPFGTDPKAEKSQAYGDYMRALDAVRQDNRERMNAANTTIVTSASSQTTQAQDPSSGEEPSSDGSGLPRLRRPQTTSNGVMTDGV